MRHGLAMWLQTIFLLSLLGVGTIGITHVCTGTLDKNLRILTLSLIRASMVKFKVQK